MTKNYLITLKPLDWFFFGGERTHGEGDKSDYLSKSNLFPQQSAILGMIRYQLLKQKDLLTTKGTVFDNETKEKINNLIGRQSFNLDNINEKASFGTIEKISPLTIAEETENKFYMPVPLDNGLDVRFVGDIDNLYLSGDVKTKIITSEKFNHKTFKNYDLWETKSAKTVSTADIWFRKTKIGITKQKAETDDEKNFYKQEYLFLKEQYVYAFYITINSDEVLNPDKIFLGGQRSVFDMKVYPAPDDSDASELFRKTIPYEKKGEKIVLLSDTYIEDIKNLNNLCLFHWSYSVPFRNIQTTTSKANYFIRPEKSIKHNFLQKGSVLYFEEENREEIEKSLNNNYLQSIGYNQYI